jgi:hypothetical protein
LLDDIPEMSAGEESTSTERDEKTHDDPLEQSTREATGRSGEEELMLTFSAR